MKRPLTKNGGLSEPPLTGKNGILELKITNNYFLTWGHFRSGQDREVEQRLVYVWKGGLLERPRTKNGF